MSLFGGSTAASADHSSSAQPSAQIDESYSGLGRESSLLLSEDEIVEHSAQEEAHDLNSKDRGSKKAGEIDQENDSDLYDSDEYSYEHRRNRYRGPPSTWRSWTRNERREVTALDQIKAKDLGVHLFNAFALKRRARLLQAKGKGGETMVIDEQEPVFEEEKPFMPSKIWTAWPMPANEAPRESRRSIWGEDDIWTLKMPVDRRPSAELEECLLAETLRVAKETFEARKWNDGAQRDMAEQLESEERIINPKRAPLLEDARPSRPVVLTDEDKARRLLHPTIRHTLSQFDDLLLNLHSARQGYAARKETSVSEPPSGAESVKSKRPAHTKPKKQTQPRGRYRVRWSSKLKKREERDSQSGSEYVESDEPQSPSPSPSIQDESLDLVDTSEALSGSRSRSRRSRQSRQERLGLRGWSDVLGVASMSGWSPATVRRATHRCARLFEEDVTFRTLPEAGPMSEEVIRGNRALTKDLDVESSASAPINVDEDNPEGTLELDEMVGGVHVDGFLQPVKRRKQNNVWKKRTRSP